RFAEMFEHIGREHDVVARTHFGRDAGSEIGLYKLAGMIADTAQLEEIDARHVVTVDPQLRGDRGVAATQVETSARSSLLEPRDNATMRVDGVDLELSLAVVEGHVACD